MRKKLKQNARVLLLVILGLMMLTPAAMAAEHPTLKLSASVKLSGNLPEKSESFRIMLSADEVSNPMPEGSHDGTSTMIVQGGGTVTFPEITFYGIGTYHYTIWQQSGLNQLAKPDTAIYHVTVYITNAENGGLEIGSVVYKKGETDKSSDLLFENIYPSSAKVQFRAVKTMDGKTPKDGKFTFQLTNEAGVVLQTKTNRGENVNFEEVSLHNTGKHIFYIREKKGSDSKVIYDESVYQVTVNVKNIQGSHKASLSYAKYGKPYRGIPHFANRTAKDLVNTGTAQSALPLIGAGLVLGGVALIRRRNKN